MEVHKLECALLRAVGLNPDKVEAFTLEAPGWNELSTLTVTFRVWDADTGELESMTDSYQLTPATTDAEVPA